MMNTIKKLIAIALVAGAVFAWWQQEETARKLHSADVERAKTIANEQRETDRALVESPTASHAEIEKRLRAWIFPSKGFILLRRRTSEGEFQVTRTLPKSRPWSVTCDTGILRLQFQGDNTEDDDSRLSLRLLPSRLTVEQCADYLQAANQIGTEIIAGM